MRTKGTGLVLAFGVLGSLLLGAAPVSAQSHGGGGGGHSGGGGNHSGGGGGGGPHFGGGGGPHFGGGAGGRAAFGGSQFAGATHYGPGGHFAPSPGYARGIPAAFHGGGLAGYHGGYARPGGNYGRPAPGGYYGRGYSTGANWRGGYWRGGFWPRCYYGVGFSWYLPLLPLAYATYWYSGVPYYYANDVYYTYNPSYDGYVATDPPPLTEESSSGAGTAVGAAGAGEIFMYPKNGQSAEQTATDKAECQQWATQQAGPVAQNGTDYQRAMVACVEGRGYSAK